MDDQGEVIAFLSDPKTFGGKPVEVAETHASLVFMAGERAFKLKRAVRYPSLDYSTLERRRAACEAECAINARFAPSLYLGVQAVCRTPDGTLQLGDQGTPAEWLVAMGRFRQENQFDEMAARGALSPELMRALADRLADLHATAPVHREAGGAAGSRQTMQATLADLRSRIGAPFAAGAVERWASRAEAALRLHAGLLDVRRRAGKVRACHGDLHLRNICLVDGEPTPFDAVEFDPKLSTIDVLYDLAFPLMDLHARGLAALGNALFNRYLDRADEMAGLAALPLFMSLRAAIRAQVAAAAQGQVREPGKAQALAQEAAHYLDLAADLLEPASPCLVAVGGRSGTGKSTLAYRLAPSLGRPPGARVVRSDVLRKRAAEVALESELPPEHYTPDSHAATYRALVAEAASGLRAGQAVVADAVFAKQAERQAIGAAAEGVPFRGLWLTAPEAVLLRRVAERTGDASDATPAVVRAQTADEPQDWQRVDATGAIDADAILSGFPRA